MKPLFEIFDAEDEKLLASQEIKKNLHKIDAKDASVVVQLSSGDVKGNMFRALRPGDTELVVGVYSVNEKGNLAVLTGLGKEPVAVISTIFDIVKNCVTKNKTIETVVFRLNKRALKGKEKLLQRIIQKLIKARFGSKFEVKEEFIDVSPAMSFIVAQKRNADEIDPEEFIEKQEKVKDKMVVKQLALDFGESDPTFKLLKKYGTPTEDFAAAPSQKIVLKANLEKVLKTARNYSFLVDSKELKLIEVLADLTSIKDVSRELEKYLKTASGKYNVAHFVENVLEQVLLAFPQSDTLSELDKAVVRRYTNEQNNGINKNLRFGEKLNQRQQKYVDELSKVISKNSQQFDLVYRVIRDMSPYEVQDWIETNVIEDKGFVSTSLAPTQFLSTYRVKGSADKQKGSVEKALDAALMNDNKFDVVLRIQDAKGVLVGDASIHKKEAEVLINKGAKFTITSIDKVIPGKTKNVIELTVTQSSNAKGGSVVVGRTVANSHPNVWPHILEAYLYNKDTDVTSLLSKDDNDGVVTESKPRNLFDIAKTILEQNSY